MSIEFEWIIFFYSQCECRLFWFAYQIIKNSNFYYVHERYRLTISIQYKKLNEINQFKQRQNHCR